MALMPARHAISTESPQAKGKKASEARTAPCASSPAFSRAMRTEFTRLGWPEPMPRSRPVVATVMALDLTCLTARQANFKASSCSGVGLTSETASNVMSSGTRESEACSSQPPPTCRKLFVDPVRGLVSKMRSVLDLPFNTSKPSGV